MAGFLVDQATGVVVNCIVCDQATRASGWQPPEGLAWVEFSGPCGIGWIWNGSTMTDPSPPVLERLPSEKTRVR
jgi:hypothetical protein